MTPGSSLPSSNSKLAPPPVDIYVTFFSYPNFLMADPVSPPPIIELHFVKDMARHNSFVPFANLSFSVIPTGPFQNIV